MIFERIDTDAFSAELIALQREFHRYPEAGWMEFRTTARIIEELEKLGLTVQYGPDIHVREKMYGLPNADMLENSWQEAMQDNHLRYLIQTMRGGYTGCVTVIEGSHPGPTIGIRVDIDCNEVKESMDFKHRPAREGFASTHEGLMHACGHDAHAAIGIGIARLLRTYQDQLRGKVILVFQPAEEGLRGAASLAAAGHFSECDYLFGLHVGIQDLPVGTIAASAEGFLSSTKLDVHFQGSPAHAGLSPELGKNAMAAASAAVLNLLAIPRHHEGASRINVGSFHSGTGRNVIPAEAFLSLETRGCSDAVNQYMEQAARRICQAAADMYECTCEITFMGAAGDALCDQPLIDRTIQILSNLDGIHTVLPKVNFGGGEDFTTLMKEVQTHGGQATELVIGMPLIAPHHNDHFDIDDRVIWIGVQALGTLVLDQMKQENTGLQDRYLPVFTKTN